MKVPPAGTFKVVLKLTYNAMNSHVAIELHITSVASIAHEDVIRRRDVIITKPDYVMYRYRHIVISSARHSLIHQFMMMHVHIEISSLYSS